MNLRGRLWPATLFSLAGVLAIGGFIRFYDHSPDVASVINPTDEADEANEEVDLAVQGPQIPRELQLDRFEDQFPTNSTLQDVLFDFGFTPIDIHNLIRDTREVYNLNQIKAGNRFVIYSLGDGRFRSLEYDIDDQKYVVVSLDNATSQYKAELKERQFDTIVEEFAGSITDNLWNTLVRMGESGKLISKMIEILQWDIAFTAIQPQDSFKVVVEKKFYKDQFVDYGDIVSLQFNNSGKNFYAFLYTHPETGEKGYFDLDGESVKKAFLKIPFKYDYRISSGFSHSRFHPVLKTRRPHLGVDYAAPHGTPVLASGSGRVIFAGRAGGNGNLVKIRHPNRYISYYLHLSKIHVRQGQSVSQGDVIGRVGSTGLATGPHLDYRIQRDDGRFLNPAALVTMPSEERVDPDYLEDFQSIRDQSLQQLESIPEALPDVDRFSVAG